MSGTANLSNGASTLPKVLFVLGGPGAGKGTQCNNLVQVCMYVVDSFFIYGLKFSDFSGILDFLLRSSLRWPFQSLLWDVHERARPHNAQHTSSVRQWVRVYAHIFLLVIVQYIFVRFLERSWLSMLWITFLWRWANIMRPNIITVKSL